MERDFVVRAQRGDASAFSALVELHLDRLYGAARLILRHDEHARDAVQDALVQAWKDIRALRDPDRFQPWIHRLLVRACYRAARTHRLRHVREVALVESDSPSLPDVQSLVATRDSLERAMHGLSPEHRAVVVARYFWGLSLAETAAVLEVPLGTVQSRLSRASAALRAAVDAGDRSAELGTEVAL
jgi:RNA polymerase sigma-70 factor (ECF subfamily)